MARKRVSTAKRAAEPAAHPGAPPRATLRDVAAAAGLSEATVSLVVRGRAAELRISHETVQRVRQACERLHYQPNYHAQRLATRTSGALAFLVPTPDDSRVLHLWGAMVSGVMRATTALGLRFYLQEMTPAMLDEGRHLQWAAEGSIEGLISWAISPTALRLDQLGRHGVPAVILDRGMPQDPWAYVKADHAHGSALAVEHLVGLGHKRIVFVRGQEGSSSSRERLAGFTAAMEAHLPTEPVRTLAGGFTEQAGHDAGERVLTQYPEATAVIAANDYAAYGVVQCLQSRRRRVPDDVSVAGAMDAELARLVVPSLTTVRVPMRQMAETAVDMVHKMAHGNATDVQRVLPVELIVRSSTAPPR